MCGKSLPSTEGLGQESIDRAGRRGSEPEVQAASANGQFQFIKNIPCTDLQGPHRLFCGVVGCVSLPKFRHAARHAVRLIESNRCGTPPTWHLFGHCTHFYWWYHIARLVLEITITFVRDCPISRRLSTPAAPVV